MAGISIVCLEIDLAIEHGELGGIRTIRARIDIRNERDGSFNLYALASRERIDKSVTEAIEAHAQWREHVLPTLGEPASNWEIEKRQKLEAQIMDLAKRGRYMEAVELARKVIARYPDSPQAEALRLRLDRLVELADDPGAPPARIRLDD